MTRNIVELPSGGSRVSPAVRKIAVTYLVVSIAAVGVLAVLSITAPQQAPATAWVRAVIVAATSVLTVIFAHRAAAGHERALLRLRILVPIILVAVVLVLLFLPLPAWMVIEQLLCGTLLLGLGTLIFRTR
jgi:hypothetical protein